MLSASSFDPWVAGQGRGALAASDVKSPKDAARAFEALMLRQYLAAARSSSWLSGESEIESGWREMADDALAGHLARFGGFGLARQIESLLTQASARSEPGRPNSATEVKASPPAWLSPGLNPSSDKAVEQSVPGVLFK